MPRWLVRRQTGGFAHNPKEIDQFLDERTTPAEVLVREAVQNSLDARLDGKDPVRIRFSLVEVTEDRKKGLAALILDSLASDQDGKDIPFRDHLKHGGASLDEILSDHSCRILIVEDFGTKGLGGPFDRQPDQENEPTDFFNFVHALGLSSKRGNVRGRHGLGKLVFAASSTVRTYFAVTRRAEDKKLLMAGVALLRYRQLRDGSTIRSYEPGAWYGERDGSGFELPVDSTEDIKTFSNLVGLERTSEPGLSVVVPWVRDAWHENDILVAVLKNYYFPIHAGRLVVDVGKTTISDQNVRSLVRSLAEHPFSEELPDGLFDFIEEVLTLPESELVELETLSVADALEEKLGEERKRALETRFEQGKLVALRVPVEASRKNGQKVGGALLACLQRRPDLERGWALVVRDDLLLPDEAKHFGTRRAYALLQAEGSIAELLGDAENPAHRGWNASSEHVKERWRNAQAVVRLARRLLPALYDLLSRDTVEDKSVLAPFFPVPSRPPVPIPEEVEENTDGTTEGDGDTDIVGNGQRLVSIRPFRENGVAGFRVTGKIDYPADIVVRVWLLDVDRRKSYDESDFNLRDDKRFPVHCAGCGLSERRQQELAFTVEGEGGAVRIDVKGFDPHRDLHVDVDVRRRDGED